MTTVRRGPNGSNREEKCDRTNRRVCPFSIGSVRSHTEGGKAWTGGSGAPSAGGGHQGRNIAVQLQQRSIGGQVRTNLQVVARKGGSRALIGDTRALTASAGRGGVVAVTQVYFARYVRWCGPN